MLNETFISFRLIEHPNRSICQARNGESRSQLGRRIEMSVFSSIGRYAADYRARRRRLQTYLQISALPREIQKDIGWPDAFTGSPARSADETFRRNH
jgi:hypothetical protein